MKFYESGDNRKPVIFLFPGTCCLYSSFDHVLDGLHSYFYTVAVSYDGFDPNEKTEFYSMEDECEKIEQEIRTKYGGRIKAAYGCSLGGSFVSLLIQRKRIHIDHGIIGSSDMDEAGNLVAKIQTSMVVPFMYKMVHTGALPKFMQKKLNKTDGAKKELYNGFLNMFGIGKGGSPWITKQSIYNQFYSDLVTKVQHGYAILVREEFSCLEFIMNRDTINWILKKLNTGGRIWSIYQRKSIKTASATRWWETTTSPIWSCRRKAAPLGGGAGCTRRFCKNTGPASTMHCFCRKNSGHILLT